MKHLILIFLLSVNNLCFSQGSFVEVKYKHKEYLNNFDATLLFNSNESIYTVKENRLKGDYLDEETFLAYSVTKDSIFRASYSNLKSNTDRVIFLKKILKTRRNDIINWNVNLNKRKQIFGYDCYFASAFFLERSLSAWFTFDIPNFFGPYIFNGLPGVVLELTNDEGLTIKAYEIRNISTKLNDNDVFKIYKNLILSNKKEQILTSNEYSEHVNKEINNLIKFKLAQVSQKFPNAQISIDKNVYIRDRVLFLPTLLNQVKKK
jgi:GLPGLI family protein